MTSESSTDCRTPEGVAVGLIDAIISNLRVLRRHYGEQMDSEAVKDALDDLRADEDLEWVLLQNAPKCICGSRGFSVAEGWTYAACCGSL